MKYSEKAFNSFFEIFKDDYPVEGENTRQMAKIIWDASAKESEITNKLLGDNNKGLKKVIDDLNDEVEKHLTKINCLELENKKLDEELDGTYETINNLIENN